MKYSLIILALILSIAPFQAQARKKKEICGATKEYITTLEYLRAQKTFAIPDQEAQKVALQVSEACNGSAQRFIKVMTSITKAGFATKDAVKVAGEFSKKSDLDVNTFIFVFKQMYLPEHFDLDLQTSVEIARSLSSAFDGDSEFARKDFAAFLDFCEDAKDLALPKPDCARMAARVTKLGEKHGPNTTKAFIKAFEFLTASDRGSNLTTIDALRIAEELVSFGPGSIENFMQGYKYAKAEGGLNLEQGKAVEFARTMASKTPSQRIPAETEKE